MTETALAERDLPQPKFVILKKTMENKTDTGETHQWLVKTDRKHVVRIIHPITDGKVKPPTFGRTDHVLVTTRYEKFSDDVPPYAETTVYGSDADGAFFNAPLYVTPGIREVWEAMYSIGEV